MEELCLFKLGMIWNKIDIQGTPGAMIYTSIDRYLIRYISQNQVHVSLNLFHNIPVRERGYENVELENLMTSFLKRLDPLDQRIIVYLIMGYKPKQISQLLELDLTRLRNRIANNRKVKWKSAFQEIRHEKIRESNTY